MKTLFFLLMLSFTASVFTQTDTTLLEKRFNDAEYNIDQAGRCLEDAGAGFQRAWLFTFLGSLTSGILIATMDKTEDGNLNGVVFIPAVIGVVGGLWNFFSATGDLKDAGYFMKKSRKK